MIEGNAREELALAVAHSIVIDAHAAAPGRAVIIGVTHIDIGVGAGGVGPVGIKEIDSSVVGTAATVPGQPGFGINVALRLGWNRDERANLGCGCTDR